MSLIFILCVLLGFVFQFIATFPVNYCNRIAWGFWLVAAILWAIPKLGVG